MFFRPGFKRKSWHLSALALVVAAVSLIAGIGLMERNRDAYPGNRRFVRGTLALPGFTVAEPAGHDAGLLVTSLRTDSEAMHSGVAVGDRILAIDSHAVSNMHDAAAAMRAERGPTMELKLVHDRVARPVVLHLR